MEVVGEGTHTRETNDTRDRRNGQKGKQREREEFLVCIPDGSERAAALMVLVLLAFFVCIAGPHPFCHTLG